MHIKIGPSAEKQEVEIHENRRILLYQKTYTKYLVITKVFQNTTFTRLKIRFVCTCASIYFIKKKRKLCCKTVVQSVNPNIIQKIIYNNCSIFTIYKGCERLNIKDCVYPAAVAKKVQLNFLEQESKVRPTEVLIQIFNIRFLM